MTNIHRVVRKEERQKKKGLRLCTYLWLVERETGSIYPSLSQLKSFSPFTDHRRRYLSWGAISKQASYLFCLAYLPAISSFPIIFLPEFDSISTSDSVPRARVQTVYIRGLRFPRWILLFIFSPLVFLPLCSFFLSFPHSSS